jgi:transposase
MTITYPIVGIDIGKDILDGAFLYSDGRSSAFSLASEKAELKKLAKSLKAKGVGLVVLEATGGYEVPVMAALAAEGVPFSRVNPSAVRHLAKSLGILEKTDRIDAKVLAVFGERVRPRQTTMPSEKEMELKALTLRRQQLVESRKREKIRAHQAVNPAIAASIKRLINALTDEIEAIAMATETLIAQMPDVAARRDLADSVPGIAATIANTIVTNLPELGTLSTAKLKKLVGVAPINDDSSTRQGKRHIRGGRSVVREALFMAAQTGYRYNPALKALYDRLRAKGRCHKLAIIACIGKLVSILNALFKTKTPFNKNYATR